LKGEGRQPFLQVSVPAGIASIARVHAIAHVTAPYRQRDLHGHAANAGSVDVPEFNGAIGPADELKYRGKLWKTRCGEVAEWLKAAVC